MTLMVRAERCLNCGGPLPAGRSMRTRYCKPSCRTLAYRVRLRTGAVKKRGAAPAPAWADGRLPIVATAQAALSDIQHIATSLGERIAAEELALRRAVALGPGNATIAAGLRQQLTEAQLQLADQQDGMERLRLDLADARGQLSSSQSEATQFRKRNAELEHKLAAAEHQLAEAQQAAAAYLTQLTEVNQRAAALSTVADSIKHAEEALQGHRAAEARAHAQLRSAEQSNRDLANQVATIKKELVAWQSVVTSLQKQLAEAEQNNIVLSHLRPSLQRAEEILERHRVSESNLQSLLQNAQERIKELETKLGQEQAEAQRLMLSESTIRTQLAEARSQIAVLTTQQERASAALAPVQCPPRGTAAPQPNWTALAARGSTAVAPASPLLRWTRSDNASPDAVPSAANSLDRLADQLVAGFAMESRRRDYHLLCRTLMHCVMEVLLRASAPLDEPHAVPAAIKLLKQILDEHPEIVPAEFRRWVDQSVPLVVKMAKKALERVANQLGTALPRTGILHRPELAARDRLLSELQAQVSQEEARRIASEQKAAALENSLSTEREHIKQLKNALSAARVESERIREHHQPDLSDDPLVRLMRDKMKLLHWIWKLQDELSEEITGCRLPDLEPATVQEAAVTAALTARRDYYYRPRSWGESVAHWITEDLQMDDASESNVYEAEQNEVARLKKLWQKLKTQDDELSESIKRRR